MRARRRQIDWYGSIFASALVCVLAVASVLHGQVGIEGWMMQATQEGSLVCVWTCACGGGYRARKK
jgi:hypothetical protein